MAFILPSTSVIAPFAADERVTRRAPRKAELRKRGHGLAREGPGVRARKVIFAEARSYVFVTGAWILVGAGFLARSYYLAYDIRRGMRIPQMS